jgi:hypothetical protein
MTETSIVEAQSPHTPTRKLTIHNPDFSGARAGSRSSVRFANKSARLSGRLRSFFDLKQKKTSESNISLMYAGTLSCPLFSHPVQELEEEQPEYEVGDDSFRGET